MKLMSRRTKLGLLIASLLVGAPAWAQVSGTPAQFRMSVATTAAKQAIYALWADPSSWPRWDPQLSSVTMSGPVRVGARGKMKSVSGPDSNIEIIAMEPGVRFAYAATGPGLRIVFDRRFEAGEATRFTHSVTISGAMSGFLAPRVGPRIQEGMPAAMQRLKGLAERANGN
jgi:uncharacterized protein YndB with AHSA1/START domain